jgi:hypothetical protein
MPGFLSLYDKTETLDLGDGFSCVFRKYLSEGDFAAASDALLANKTYQEAATATVTAKVNTGAYHRSLVVAALVSWNLTDENSNVMPINEATLKALPNVVFRKMLNKVMELNNEVEATAEAEVDFRPEGTSSN